MTSSPESESKTSSSSDRLTQEIIARIRQTIETRQQRVDRALELAKQKQLESIEQIKTNAQTLTDLVQQITQLSDLTSDLRKSQADGEKDREQTLELIAAQQQQIAEQQAQIRSSALEKKRIIETLLQSPVQIDIDVESEEV